MPWCPVKRSLDCPLWRGETATVTVDEVDYPIQAVMECSPVTNGWDAIVFGGTVNDGEKSEEMEQGFRAIQQYYNTESCDEPDGDDDNLLCGIPIADERGLVHRHKMVLDLRD